jgi:hypothetical protein
MNRSVRTNDPFRGIRIPVYRNTIRKSNHNADEEIGYDEG